MRTAVTEVPKSASSINFRTAASPLVFADSQMDASIHSGVIDDFNLELLRTTEARCTSRS